MPQKIFSVGRLVFGLGIAKTGCWQVTGHDGEVRIIWFGLHTVKRVPGSALSIIAGPLSIIVGIRPTHNGGES